MGVQGGSGGREDTAFKNVAAEGRKEREKEGEVGGLAGTSVCLQMEGT